LNWFKEEYLKKILYNMFISMKKNNNNKKKIKNFWGYKNKFDRKKYLKKLCSISFFFKNSLCNNFIKENNIKFLKKWISFLNKRRIKGYFFSKNLSKLEKIKFINFKTILLKNDNLFFLKGNFWVNLSCVKRLFNLLKFSIVDLIFLKKRKINFTFFFLIDNSILPTIDIKSRKFESFELFINLNLMSFKDIIFD
jgi:hypothetical protein